MKTITEVEISEIKKNIEIITSSSLYEGDFGDTISKSILLKSGVSKDLVENKYLSNYYYFLENIGFGELDDSFFIEDAPINSFEIFGKDRKHLEHLYIFANNMSEYSYAFDFKNKCNVVSIDSSGDVSKLDKESFSDFIKSKIEELVEIVKWREQDFS
ncbi:hypothetical protein ACOSP6_14885 [Tenacibaculum sp. MEBiC06402]|uniref:hypothetical protein n=1 Tax=unclassified Tenacibaculum TaxID=2635139 RepID=UPI003B9CC055